MTTISRFNANPYSPPKTQVYPDATWNKYAKELANTKKLLDAENVEKTTYLTYKYAAKAMDVVCATNLLLAIDDTRIHNAITNMAAGSIGLDVLALKFSNIVKQANESGFFAIPTVKKLVK